MQVGASRQAAFKPGVQVQCAVQTLVPIPVIAREQVRPVDGTDAGKK